MKVETIQKIVNKNLIGTNSEIHGDCKISLFGGGFGRTKKTILLEKIVQTNKSTVFQGHSLREGDLIHIDINDIDTLEGMHWHKFALAYGLVKK
jgi:hypothetical protein